MRHMQQMFDHQGETAPAFETNASAERGRTGVPKSTDCRPSSTFAPHSYTSHTHTHTHKYNNTQIYSSFAKPSSYVTISYIRKAAIKSKERTKAVLQEEKSTILGGEIEEQEGTDEEEEGSLDISISEQGKIAARASLDTFVNNIKFEMRTQVCAFFFFNT